MKALNNIPTPQVIKPEGQITDFTNDLIELFLSYVDNEADIMSAAMVSKFWSAKMIKVQEILMEMRLYDMLDCIVNNLNDEKYSALRDEFSKQKEQKITDSKNLIDVKCSFAAMECGIMKVLTKLSNSEELALQERIGASRNVNPVAKLSDLLPSYEQFFKTKNKEFDYFKITRMFIEKDAFEPLFSLIFSDEGQDYRKRPTVLKYLCITCVKEEKFNEAIRVLDKINSLSLDLGDDSFDNFVSFLAGEMPEDKALRPIFKTIDLLHEKPASIKERKDRKVDACFRQFECDAKHNYKYDLNKFKIAISDDRYNYKFDINKFKKALRIAVQHSPTFDKLPVIKECSKGLFDKFPDHALKVIKLMGNEVEESKLLLELLKEYLSGIQLNPTIELLAKSSKIADAISEEPYRTEAFTLRSNLIEKTLATQNS